MIDSSYLNLIDDCIFSVPLAAFCLFRIVRNKRSSLLRKTGIFFLIVSVASLFAFNSLLLYLGSLMRISRKEIETVGYLDKDYRLSLNDRSINMTLLVNIAYSLQHIFRTSAVFILIGLWLPCATNYMRRRRRQAHGAEDEPHGGAAAISTLIGSDAMPDDIGAKYADLFFLEDKLTHRLTSTVTHESITTFSVLYAVIRIPFTLFIDFYHQDRQKASIFFRAIFYGFENYLAVFFLVVLQIKFFSSIDVGKETRRGPQGRESGRSTENINILVLTILTSTFLKYTIQVLSVPFSINNTSFYVLSKVESVSTVVMYLLLVTLFCPLSGQITESDRKKGKDFFVDDVNFGKTGMIEFKGKKEEVHGK